MSAQDLHDNEGHTQETGNKKPAQPKSKTPFLDNFGRDLTKLASEGKIDSVVGRDDEIDSVIQILSRRKKNNPVLVGEAGTGKSTIVEGLAKRIVEKKVSRILHNKRIINLDINALISGTKFRGEFEQRMKVLLDELIENQDCIVFIDEIHTIIGSGNSAGGLDVANILKPALSRGEIKVIGATTPAEWRESVEKDKALERRFQKIVVEPPSKEETREILNQIKFMYEDFHNVKFSEEAIESAIYLSDRYITHRNFPDKAIDIIDETGSRVHIDNLKLPTKIVALEKEKEELLNEKNKYVKSQNYEKAAKIRDLEKDLDRKIELEKANWEKEEKQNKIPVNDDDVIKVVAKMVKIPITKLSESEGVRLLKMGDVLKEKVIGQDDAIDKIAEAIQISKSGLNDPRKPIASFLFLGQTGVGKTFLCKQLAEYLFNDENAFVRFDMSEYAMPHTVSRLVGSPPGFVDSSKGGELTEAVRNKNYTLVVFDELEKAHEDVRKILLQILDDGRLTDAQGREVNFKNTIIVMTSNAGSKELSGFKKLGFDTTIINNSQEDINAVIEKALKKHFTPEFLNRIDARVIFNKLSGDNILKVVEVNVKRWISDSEKQGYIVEVGDKLKKVIAEKGFSEEYGARPLLRAIKEYVQKPLSKEILLSKIKKGDKISVDWDNKKEEVIIKKK